MLQFVCGPLVEFARRPVAGCRGSTLTLWRLRYLYVEFYISEIIDELKLLTRVVNFKWLFRLQEPDMEILVALLEAGECLT